MSPLVRGWPRLVHAELARRLWVTLKAVCETMSGAGWHLHVPRNDRKSQPRAARAARGAGRRRRGRRVD